VRPAFFERMTKPEENRLATALSEGRALARRYRTQLILALRVTVAALSSLALAQALNLRLPLWAVLTSLIVTQMSLGRSVKVASDYLIGTLAGVAYGGTLAILIPHDSELALLGVLALAVAPLAFVAAFRANFNVLPITAIIVLLVPTMQHVSPAVSAFDRVLEVTVGGIVGFIVSFVVFPSRAHALITDTAADTLVMVADALFELLKDYTSRPDGSDLRRRNDRIAAALARLNATGTEAEHERNARLTSGPDTGPLLRTLLRLRHDIVILGRGAGCQLPDEVAQRLVPKLRQIADATGAFLRESAVALRARELPPQLDGLECAFEAYAEELGTVRREGMTQDMPSEQTERSSALGFALDQLHAHLNEVHRVVGEWAPQ
jgi:uncharacterized membrane protein YccC